MADKDLAKNLKKLQKTKKSWKLSDTDFLSIWRIFLPEKKIKIGMSKTCWNTLYYFGKTFVE